MVEIIAVKGTMVVINTGASIFQANRSKLRRPLDTVSLEELPGSRERTGALERKQKTLAIGIRSSVTWTSVCVYLNV